MVDTVVSASITIDSPQQDVWDVVTTPSSWVDWYGYALDDVVPAWQVGAVLQMGSQGPEITEFQPPSRLSWSKSSLTLTLVSESSTEVVLEQVVSDPLGDPLFVEELSQGYRESSDEILHRLKARLES